MTSLLEKLKQIKPQPSATSCLCDYLPLKDLESIVRYFETWPHYSHDPNFPVPCPDGGDPETAYFDAPDMWRGDYGALRMDLLDHLIKCLELTPLALHALKCVRDSPNPKRGICSNILGIITGDNFGFIMVHIIRPLYEDWPHYSGSDTYPIPGGFNAFDKCTWGSSFWEGEQGEYRHDLLNYLINRLENETAN